MEYHLVKMEKAKPNGLGIVSVDYYNAAKFKCEIVYTGSFHAVTYKKSKTK